jgi:hypothetical protein
MARLTPILASTLGIALSLTMVEVAFRVFGPEALAATKKSESKRDGVSTSNGAPVTGGLKRYRREINSYRYHDNEWRPKQPRGSWRTVVLGDSFTEGKMVARENLFTERVETRFNQLAEGSRRYEMLNVAHAGWGTRNELLALEALIDGNVTFDSVLLVYFINDATLLESNPILVSALEKQKQREQSSSQSWSRAWNHFTRKQKREALTALTLTDYRRAFEESSEQQVTWRRSQAALAKIQELSRRHNFELGVVLFPVLAELNPGHQLIDLYERVAEYCRDLGIPYHSLLPAFMGYSAQELWVSPSNAHANAKGHAIAATAIETFLVEENLVPLPMLINASDE